MPNIAVITDSNAHFTPEEEKEYGIMVVPMPFTIGEETFYENITLSREEFYKKMAEGANIVTSQPSPSDVMSIWDKALETHDEVVYIPMSSGLSGSCQSARMLADDYDGKVQVVNNQRISVTQKRSVLDAIEMARSSCSIRCTISKKEAGSHLLQLQWELCSASNPFSRSRESGSMPSPKRARSIRAKIS